MPPQLPPASFTRVLTAINELGAACTAFNASMDRPPEPPTAPPVPITERRGGSFHITTSADPAAVAEALRAPAAPTVDALATARAEGRAEALQAVEKMLMAAMDKHVASGRTDHADVINHLGGPFDAVWHELGLGHLGPYSRPTHGHGGGQYVDTRACFPVLDAPKPSNG